MKNRFLLKFGGSEIAFNHALIVTLDFSLYTIYGSGMKSNRAFTLIETLVVVVIVVILMGLLVPVVTKMRRVADKNNCRNNIKQLYVAVDNWMVDGAGGRRLPHAVSWENYDDKKEKWVHHKGWVAWGTWTENNRQKRYKWHIGDGAGMTIAYSCVTNGALWKYVGSESMAGVDIYACPTFKKDSDLNTLSGNGEVIWNYCMFTNAGNKSYLGVTNATRLPVFGERRFTGNNTDQDPECSTNNIADYHDGISHIIYLDGHIDIFP